MLMSKVGTGNRKLAGRKVIVTKVTSRHRSRDHVNLRLTTSPACVIFLTEGRNMKAVKKAIEGAYEIVVGQNKTMIPSLAAEASHKVIDIFKENARPGAKHRRVPLLIAQPQSGKTITEIAIMDRYLDRCIEDKKKYQLVSLCGLPNLDLRKQTSERLKLATTPDGKAQTGAMLNVKAMLSGYSLYPAEDMDKGVLIYHNSQALKKVDLTTVPAERRLIVIDECCVGFNKSGSIEHFLKKHDVDLSQQMPWWGNGKTQNDVVPLSATPFAHMIAADEVNLAGESLFTIVYMPPSKGYNSLKMMRENGRLQQVEPLSVAGKASEFFTKLKQDFEAQAPGYCVVRAVGSKNAELVSLINQENRKGHKTAFKQFDEAEGNLDELLAFLSKKPTEPTFVLIRGSMRAGITLGHKHYVRAWVETATVKRDVVAQAGAGRACGYGREKDRYKIYCNLDAVDEVIRLYDDLDMMYYGGRKVIKAVPAGRQNKAAGDMGSQGKNCYRVLGLTTFEEADRAVAGRGSRKIGATGKKVNDAQVSTLSANTVTIVGELLLFRPGLLKRDNGSVIGYKIDRAPTRQEIENAFMTTWRRESKQRYPTKALRDDLHRRHVAAFRQIEKEHPEWIGWAVMLDTKNPVSDRTFQKRNDLHKPKSALKRPA